MNKKSIKNLRFCHNKLFFKYLNQSDHKYFHIFKVFKHLELKGKISILIHGQIK